MTFDFKQTDEKLSPTFDFLKSNGEIVGHQDQLAIIKATCFDDILYGILNQHNELTTIASFREKDPRALELHVIHTLSEFRGRGDAARILWFLKSQEGKAIIDHGVQSLSGMRFIMSLAASKRFEINWFNEKTKEKISYDPNKDGPNNEPFRSLTKITNWKILIEGDDKPSLPRFYYPDPFPRGNVWTIFEDAADEI